MSSCSGPHWHVSSSHVPSQCLVPWQRTPVMRECWRVVAAEEEGVATGLFNPPSATHELPEPCQERARSSLPPGQGPKVVT